MLMKIDHHALQATKSWMGGLQQEFMIVLISPQLRQLEKSENEARILLHFKKALPEGVHFWKRSC